MLHTRDIRAAAADYFATCRTALRDRLAAPDVKLPTVTNFLAQFNVVPADARANLEVKQHLVLSIEEFSYTLWDGCDQVNADYEGFVSESLGPGSDFLPEATANLTSALAAALAVECDRATAAATFARVVAAARFALPRDAAVNLAAHPLAAVPIDPANPNAPPDHLKAILDSKIPPQVPDSFPHIPQELPFVQVIVK